MMLYLLCLLVMMDKSGDSTPNAEYGICEILLTNGGHESIKHERTTSIYVTEVFVFVVSQVVKRLSVQDMFVLELAVGL